MIAHLHSSSKSIPMLPLWLLVPLMVLTEELVWTSHRFHAQVNCPLVPMIISAKFFPFFLCYIHYKLPLHLLVKENKQVLSIMHCAPETLKMWSYGCGNFTSTATQILYVIKVRWIQIVKRCHIWLFQQVWILIAVNLSNFWSQNLPGSESLKL